MKLSRLIPAIAAVGGAVAFAVYKLQNNKKEIMKLDEGLLTDDEEDSAGDFHIDEVKSTADVDDVDVDIPAFKEQNAQEEPYVMDEETKAKIESNPNNFYYNAPTVLILSADKNFKWSKFDAGIATANMTLAAQSMGLGNLVIGIIYDAMYGDKKDYYAKALDFPQNYEFAIAFAVGHKNTEKEPHEFDFDNSVSFI